MIAGDVKAGQGAAANRRLWLALVISVVLHLGGYGVVQMGRALGWNKIPAPEWMKKMSLAKLVPPLPPREKKPEERKPKKTAIPPEPPPPPDIPLTFLEVDPLLAEAEPPKEAKYYSALSTKAANPNIKVESDVPNIDGRQDKVARTMDSLKPPPPPPNPAPPQPPQPKPVNEPPPTPQPLQPPSPPEKEQMQAKAEEPKPKASQTPGDLAYAKPSPNLRKETGLADTKKGDAEARKAEVKEAKKERPRTVAQALAQADYPRMEGDKMKQEGGVPRIRADTSLNAIGSPFGVYDAAIIAAIQRRWYDLIAQQKGARTTGKVVISFRLHYDGRVDRMQMPENSAGELYGLLCQRAILDPAPYARWPAEMRRLYTSDHRDVTFTFYYE